MIIDDQSKIHTTLFSSSRDPGILLLFIEELFSQGVKYWNWQKMLTYPVIYHMSVPNGTEMYSGQTYRSLLFEMGKIWAGNIQQLVFP